MATLEEKKIEFNANEKRFGSVKREIENCRKKAEKEAKKYVKGISPFKRMGDFFKVRLEDAMLDDVVNEETIDSTIAKTKFNTDDYVLSAHTLVGISERQAEIKKELQNKKIAAAGLTGERRTKLDNEIIALEKESENLGGMTADGTISDGLRDTVLKEVELRHTRNLVSRVIDSLKVKTLATTERFEQQITRELDADIYAVRYAKFREIIKNNFNTSGLDSILDRYDPNLEEGAYTKGNAESFDSVVDKIINQIGKEKVSVSYGKGKTKNIRLLKSQQHIEIMKEIREEAKTATNEQVETMGRNGAVSPLKISENKKTKVQLQAEIKVRYANEKLLALFNVYDLYNENLKKYRTSFEKSKESGVLENEQFAEYCESAQALQEQIYEISAQMQDELEAQLQVLIEPNVENKFLSEKDLKNENFRIDRQNNQNALEFVEQVLLNSNFSVERKFQMISTFNIEFSKITGRNVGEIEGVQELLAESEIIVKELSIEEKRTKIMQRIKNLEDLKNLSPQEQLKFAENELKEIGVENLTNEYVEEYLGDLLEYKPMEADLQEDEIAKMLKEPAYEIAQLTQNQVESFINMLKQGKNIAQAQEAFEELSEQEKSEIVQQAEPVMEQLNGGAINLEGLDKMRVANENPDKIDYKALTPEQQARIDSIKYVSNEITSSVARGLVASPAGSDSVIKSMETFIRKEPKYQDELAKLEEVKLKNPEVYEASLRNYTEQIAMAHDVENFSILADYQTPGRKMLMPILATEVVSRKEELTGTSLSNEERNVQESAFQIISERAVYGEKRQVEKKTEPTTEAEEELAQDSVVEEEQALYQEEPKMETEVQQPTATTNFEKSSAMQKVSARYVLTVADYERILNSLNSILATYTPSNVSQLDNPEMEQETQATAENEVQMDESVAEQEEGFAELEEEVEKQAAAPGSGFRSHRFAHTEKGAEEQAQVVKSNEELKPEIQPEEENKSNTTLDEDYADYMNQRSGEDLETLKPLEELTFEDYKYALMHESVKTMETTLEGEIKKFNETPLNPKGLSSDEYIEKAANAAKCQTLMYSERKSDVKLIKQLTESAVRTAESSVDQLEEARDVLGNGKNMKRNWSHAKKLPTMIDIKKEETAREVIREQLNNEEIEEKVKETFERLTDEQKQFILENGYEAFFSQINEEVEMVPEIKELIDQQAVSMKQNLDDYVINNVIETDKKLQQQREAQKQKEAAEAMKTEAEANMGKGI